MTLIAFALACSGMLALSLAMSRHHRDLFNTSPSERRRRILRLFGVLSLMGCVISSLTGNSLALGWVIAAVQIMLAGLVVGLILAWRKTQRAA
ncbi:Protein of unknown function [Halopseudomonas litoralis]|uniref:DUF3325 domain-containing protein n=1 Tax=Halopseudomonas litoralis TaxID=797277 RepID=A0A1H1LPH7_9GAMM|nr:DUF3325 domain-containing protein [Halopseudomonas litoralis]SDR76287.1 Protein of unknown function [Halopseudomonas litoralis]